MLQQCRRMLLTGEKTLAAGDCARWRGESGLHSAAPRASGVGGDPICMWLCTGSHRHSNYS
jgi:hypothetical protein